MTDVDCIIPAAGRSSRMGTWKPILPFGESTIIETVVETALKTCRRILLVAGYRGTELHHLFLHNRRVQKIQNKVWQNGMFSSIQLAVEQVQSERFFITLADMPFVTAPVYEALLSAPQNDVVAPLYQNRRGHPVLIDGRTIPTILQSGTETTMRDILKAFSVTTLPWGDNSVLRDIDTPKDLHTFDRT